MGVCKPPTIVRDNKSVTDLADGNNYAIVRADVKLTQIIEKWKEKNVENNDACVQ
jgi:hypothetical protein